MIYVKKLFVVGVGWQFGQNSLSKNIAGYFYLIVNKKQLLYLEVLIKELSLSSYYIILIGCTLYIPEDKKTRAFIDGDLIIL